MKANATLNKWASRIESHMAIHDGSIETFIHDYVPSSAINYELPSDVDFSDVPFNGTEIDMYSPLVRSNSCMFHIQTT
jgi:hypothetical protein